MPAPPSPLSPSEAARLLAGAGLLPSPSAPAGPAGVEVVRLTGGCTNVIYRADVVVGSGGATSYILRFFGEGTEELIDRSREACCFRAVSGLGLGPRLLGDFPGGRIEEFVRGRPLTAADVRAPAVSVAVARQLGRLHASLTEVDGLDPGKPPALFPQLRAWARLALERCGPAEYGGWDLAQLAREVDRLEARLSPLGSPVCFCHNDLSHLNIMLVDGAAAAGGEERVVFVDLEYAGWNHRGFDLANHFCEWASDFQSPRPHLLDFARRYPTREERRRFLRAYLNAVTGDETVDEEELAGLVREVDAFALASHLLWGVWGLLQSRGCQQQDQGGGAGFDYLTYVRQRLEQYFRGMAEAERDVDR